MCGYLYIFLFDPDYVNIYHRNNITAEHVDSFVKRYKPAKAEGKQQDRNFEITNTLAERIQD